MLAGVGGGAGAQPRAIGHKLGRPVVQVGLSQEFAAEHVQTVDEELRAKSEDGTVASGSTVRIDRQPVVGRDKFEHVVALEHAYDLAARDEQLLPGALRILLR